jgi:murein biosynthesis integral membrane protein MurJ
MLKIIEKIKRNAILKSSVGLLVITLLIKVFGYAEKIILAYYYGTSYQVDVYTIIITIILSLFFFFREIIEPGFLNVFMSTRNKGDEKGAWNLFNQGIRLILVITIIITVFTVLFPGKVINIFAPGFEGMKLNLSTKLIQIAIPACIFLAISTLTSITLNALKIFVLPASGELAFKGIIILCIVVFYQGFGIAGAAIGIVVGAIGRLIVHLIRLYDKISFRPVIANKAYLKNVWLLTWPLLIGVTFSQLSIIIDNIFASYLQEGAIAALSYSRKIIELPVIIFPYILSIVVFPYFSQLAIEKDQQRLSFLLSESFRWIAITFIPLSIFFFIYSNPIIEIILQRGAFNAHSTLLTAKPLAIYSLGLLFFAIETILVIFYYANADTKTPIFIGIGCVLLNIILTWFFIHIIGYVGIALAYVIQKTLKTIILLFLLKRKIQFNNKKIVTFLYKLLLSSIIFFMIVMLSKVFYNIYNLNLIMKLLLLAGIFTIGGLIYIAILYFTGGLKVKNNIPTA